MSCWVNGSRVWIRITAFKSVYAQVKKVYAEYVKGGTDPTGGSIYYSMQTSLSRKNSITGSSTKFKNYSQLALWFDTNLAFERDQNSGFFGGRSDPFDQYHWNTFRGVRLKGNPAIFLYGNDVCIADGQCGLERPYANRPDLLPLP